MRIATVLIIVVFIAAFIGCRKYLAGTESDLYGTWIKGNQSGDTLKFVRQNNKNVMLINESFNAGMPVYTEKEYTFRNGVLKIKTFSPVSQDYYSIDSFTWTQAGSEFKIMGVQLFMFMSSMTYFTYRKI